MRRYKAFLVEGREFEMRLDEARTVLVQYKIGTGGFGEGV